LGRLVHSTSPSLYSTSSPLGVFPLFVCRNNTISGQFVHDHGNLSAPSKTSSSTSANYNTATNTEMIDTRSTNTGSHPDDPGVPPPILLLLESGAWDVVCWKKRGWGRGSKRARKCPKPRGKPPITPRKGTTARIALPALLPLLLLRSAPCASARVIVALTTDMGFNGGTGGEHLYVVPPPPVHCRRNAVKHVPRLVVTTR